MSPRGASAVTEEGSATRPSPRLTVRLARTWDDVEEAQALRYAVFAGEMGARLTGPRPGLDADRFDAFCDHLLVHDAGSGELVACTRLLSDVAAVQAGGHYSASEFDLTRVLALPGRILEIGRTCVAADHRNGATIAVLWSGLASYVAAHRFDSLIGCASIGLADGGGTARAIMGELRRRFLAPPELRVEPRQPLPAGRVAEGDLQMPPLLKAYLRLGAWACGELSWDPDFNVADVFILLHVDRLSSRYERHFVERTGLDRPGILAARPRAAARGARRPVVAPGV